MTQLPFVSIVILMLWCLATLCLIWTEVHWEDQLINIQHAINEVLLYVILLQVSIFCGLTPAAVTASVLGWTLITIILATLIINITIIVYMSIIDLKLIGRRHWNIYRAKKANS